MTARPGGNVISIVTAEPWMADGACVGCDPDLFFPSRGESACVTEAKAVCAICPVRLVCLEYAMRAPEKFGIWGGLSERERRKLRRNRKPGRFPKTCDICDTPFLATTSNGRYCSEACGYEATKGNVNRFNQRKRSAS